MLVFCPICSNTLIVTRQPPLSSGLTSGAVAASDLPNRLSCRTCPYQYTLTSRLFERRVFACKEPDDVLGDDEDGSGGGAWANCEEADAQCPNGKCDGTRARFYQLQIRSADEPMTSFFKCVKCKREWREN